MMTAAAAAHPVSSPKSSPAAVVRAFDSAYDSGHWLRACRDFTVTLAGRIGKGYRAAGPYDRCADELTGAVGQLPRAGEAMELTIGSGRIVGSTRTGNTARVTVRYTVEPPISPAKFRSRQTFKVITHGRGWLISGGSVL
jgi:hypothetical protein